MDRGMEWLIGGILALIIAIVGFYYTKKATAIIVPIIFIIYGVYRVVSLSKTCVIWIFTSFWDMNFFRSIFSLFLI